MSPISLLVPLCFAAGPLTIDAAVERALSRAPELRAAQHGERAAEERVEQARAAYYPRVSVEAGYLAKWPKNELPIDLSSLRDTIPGLPDIGDVDDVHHFNAGVQAGIVLFDLTRGAKVEALEQQTNAERQKTAENEASLAFQTRSTFLAALYARDVAKISEQSLSIAREEEARARLRQEVGTGTEVALAQARVRRSSLEAQAKRANHDLLRYRAQLGSLIGEDVPEISGELEHLVSSSSIAPDRLQRSPAILRLQALRESALASAKARSRTLVPTVSAMGKAEVQYPRAMKLETGPVLSAGINLSWLVFDGFSRSSGVDEAEAQASQLEESIRATEETLSRKLIELDARRRTATADLGSARESQQQAEVYVRAARAAVESGTGTELELNTAKNTLDQSNVAVSQALFARAIVDAEELVIYGVTK